MGLIEEQRLNGRFPARKIFAQRSFQTDSKIANFLKMMLKKINSRLRLKRKVPVYFILAKKSLLKSTLNRKKIFQLKKMLVLAKKVFFRLGLKNYNLTN